MEGKGADLHQAKEKFPTKNFSEFYLSSFGSEIGMENIRLLNDGAIISKAYPKDPTLFRTMYESARPAEQRKMEVSLDL